MPTASSSSASFHIDNESFSGRLVVPLTYFLLLYWLGIPRQANFSTMSKERKKERKKERERKRERERERKKERKKERKLATARRRRG